MQLGKNCENRQYQFSLESPVHNLESVTSIKDLGVEIDDQLCLEEHASVQNATAISLLVQTFLTKLDEVKDSKYLVVTISDNLDWSKHITTTTTKATARLSFIKRNLKDCPQKLNLKEIAYFSLVRSFVDYASAVWDPHQKFNQ